jgi:hypothetical protein
MAIAAGRAESRRSGLPLIVIEQLIAPSGPDEAA